MSEAIKQALENIANAVYGRDVRQSIYDGIKTIYEESIGNPAYYTPELLEDGRMSWTGNKEGMEPIISERSVISPDDRVAIISAVFALLTDASEVAM